MHSRPGTPGAFVFVSEGIMVSMLARLVPGMFLIWLAGCSSGALDSVGKVTGSVTLDGKPVAGAVLNFVPVDSKLRSNTAVTDDNGAFEVKAHPTTKVTLQVGQYNVFIKKMVDKSGRVPNSEEATQLEAAGQLKNAIPAWYGPMDEMPPQLKADIKKGDNPLPPFQLVSKWKR